MTQRRKVLWRASCEELIEVGLHAHAQVAKHEGDQESGGKFRMAGMVLKDLGMQVLGKLSEQIVQEYQSQAKMIPDWPPPCLRQKPAQAGRGPIEPRHLSMPCVDQPRLSGGHLTCLTWVDWVIEGLNNKAKITMIKAYEFRTFRMTEIALYHGLGWLPETRLTHSFY